MKLTVKPITRRLKGYKEICSLMNTAFPKDELISLTFWRILALRKGVKFSAFYDGEKLIGTLYSVEFENYIFVTFLAICEKERNKGYGSQILAWIKENVSKIIVLHIEPLNPSAENYRQRMKRVAFYNRNGIDDTHYRFVFRGVPFAVYSSDIVNFDITIHKKLLEWLSFNRTKFDFIKDD